MTVNPVRSRSAHHLALGVLPARRISPSAWEAWSTVTVTKSALCFRTGGSVVSDMRAVVSDQGSDDATRKRLGRAVLFLLLQAPVITDNLVRADIDTLLLTGRAMDFAARLQGYGATATPQIAISYARMAGLSERDLRQVLPILKRADVIDYSQTPDGAIGNIEEYVGITATVIEQTYRVLDALGPSDNEAALLHSIEIAAWAPLTQSQHLDQVSRRGLPDRAAQEGLRLALAAGINHRVRSAELNEQVVFNSHVWGTGQVQIATFLGNLPSNERDVIFSIFEQAAARPGVSLDQITANSAMLNSARKIGLIQAATVKSSQGSRSRTYVFSPLLQAADDGAVTTEALHLRKLFVAHILFGQEQAVVGRGQIRDPTVLVGTLLNRGRVGPATNIGTDYHMLEMHGVVRVEPYGDTGRAYLRLLKREIAEGGLDWLRAGFGGIPGTGSDSARLHRAPGSFMTPEADRANLPDVDASNEIMVAAVLALREEAQRAARADSPFPPHL